MRVRLLLGYLSYRAGSVLDLPDDKAKMLIAVGAAEKVNGDVATTDTLPPSEE